ncbi:MAG: tail fiber protein, partial [Muribaculaceae bacterium]|nr:tail fiber protein [Muribaculaceae bacterium]
MKTILGNFLTQPNRDFPLDCETLDYLQTLTAMTAIIGNVAGDKTVLYGCEPNSDGTRRSAGYVFLRTKAQPEGEVLYWEGGPTSGGMYLKQEDVPVNANNTAYPKAYTRRTLAPGLGEEGYNWADFTDIKTIKELMAEDKALLEKLAGIQQEPPGIIKMWAGQSVPEGYLLCNGAQYSITDYPELYSVLGNSFNTALSASGQPYTTQSGFFRVPDLQGRFVVGRHESDNDYRTMGQGGGFKSVALEENQMPKHKH